MLEYTKPLRAPFVTKYLYVPNIHVSSPGKKYIHVFSNSLNIGNLLHSFFFVRILDSKFHRTNFMPWFSNAYTRTTRHQLSYILVGRVIVCTSCQRCVIRATSISTNSFCSRLVDMGLTQVNENIAHATQKYRNGIFEI